MHINLENNSNVKAKPFLKWAGGKKQIVDLIDQHLPKEIGKNEVIEKYFEPFLGGGAVFFHLKSKYTIKQAYLSDINQELILTYEVIKDSPEELIEELQILSDDFLPKSLDERKEYYYNIRDEFNNTSKNFDKIIRASQMIFLNRTCFNGLYRVNKDGKFNVPIGSYKNPLICDKNNLLNVSELLKDVKIVCDDYSKSLNEIDENSFVYLDPPYLPIKENSFTGYSSDGFGINEQIELSDFCKTIDKKNAKFLLSNSNPKNSENKGFFNEHYDLVNKLFNYQEIDVRRSINSNKNKRGPIKEILIYNF